NRKNLESTLCTLPMGLTPYQQTSSWGQWFNVRVTKVLFKDNNGHLISSSGEQPIERGDKSAGPVVTCGAAPSLQRSGDTGSNSGSSSNGTSLRDFIDFVTGGGAR